MTARLSSIRRYPMKSCRGDELTEARVEPWGLEGDRRWMVVTPDGAALTARVEPRMLLIHPEIADTGIRVSAAGHESIAIPAPVAARAAVRIWSDTVEAADAGDAAAEWFSRTLKRPVRLVHLTDPRARPFAPELGHDGGTVSFADAHPLLLTTTASLAALNEAIAERDPDEMVPMARFRPNVVISGTDAWAEDDWRRIRIGGVEFRAAGGCARCALTLVDPDTAEKGKEPIRTLARIRRFDGSTWFGVDLVPVIDPSAPALLRVGDEVEILDAVPPGAGPLRTMGAELPA